MTSRYPLVLNGTSIQELQSGDTLTGYAASGSNSDITSLSGLTTPLSVAQGGSNNTTFTTTSGGTAGLVFYDGTKLTNGATVTNVGYNDGTSTFYANNVIFSGNATFNRYTETVFTSNTGSSITLALTNGTVQILTMNASPTITFPTATAGAGFTILLKQDYAGSRSPTWSSNVMWPSNTAPTVTSTANKGDKFTFVGDGTYWWGSVAGQNYL